jgi:hypothetical protein
MIAMALRGGGEVKNRQGKTWEVPSDHNTTRIFEGPREKNFQKKMAGEDPLDPLTEDGYFKRPHTASIDGDIWLDSGWCFVSFGVGGHLTRV